MSAEQNKAISRRIPLEVFEQGRLERRHLYAFQLVERLIKR